MGAVSEARAFQPSRYDRLGDLALSAVAVVFATRVSGGPHLFDAGELVAASFELGASHPPGQPLHALLARALVLMPLGPIPARIALFSAAAALAACALGAQLTRELCRHLGVEARRASLAAAATVLAIAGSTIVLRQALRVEVYTLALALTSWSALHVTRWGLGQPSRQLWLGAFAAGLAAAVHPPHAIAAVLFGLGVLVCAPLRARERPLALPLAAAFTLAGLAVYLYLPLRARAGAMMWGRPEELAGFVDYVTARAYAMNTVAGGRGSFGRALLDFAGHLLRAGAAVSVVGVLLALLPRVGASRRVLGGVLTGGLLALLAACIQPLELGNPDNVAYLGPTFSLLASAGAAGYATLHRGALGVVGALGTAALVINPYSLAHADDIIDGDLPALETLAGSLVETPPPRALVVVTTDFDAASFMMARSVDGARPDVALFVAGLATSSWHWKTLATHPAFDGKPRLGAGRDAHRRYLRGALELGIGRVAVALERDVFGVRVSAQAGAYTLLFPPGPLAPQGLLKQSIGERVHPVIAREAKLGPDGDNGAAAAVLRDYMLVRARRLFSLGRTRDALAAFAEASWPLPARQRELLTPPGSELDNAQRSPNLPPTVDEPGSFLATRASAVRDAAAALFAAGLRERGARLLGAQADEGDPRALLQLSWLQLYAGDTEHAGETLRGALAQAPELHPESRDLAAAIARARAQRAAPPPAPRMPH